MRHDTVNRIQRMLLLISFIALGGIALIAARVAGYGLPGLDGLAPQGVERTVFNKQVVLISGHAGFDSGAVCTDAEGNVTLTEADINARVAELVADRLRRAGADVEVFEEYDTRLNGLYADVLVSLHADSCIDTSGFKAANSSNSAIPMIEGRLLDCINEQYAESTGLEIHGDSVTYDMTEYHAFNRVAPETPAIILEMGFMGGNRSLLANRPQAAAKGVTDGILCFFNQEQ